MNNEDAIFYLLKSNEHHHAIGDFPHSALSVEAFYKAIAALKAERPKGKWEEGTQGYYCSKCNYYDQSYFEHNFCPNCGADMRGDEENE